MAPGQIHTLGEHVRLTIEDVVENGQTQVGHTQVVDVWEGQRHARGDGGPFFHDLVQLAAGVAAWLLHRGQDASQKAFDFGWVHAWIVLESTIWTNMVGIVT